MRERILDTDDYHNIKGSSVQPDGSVKLFCCLNGVGECVLSPGRIDPDNPESVLVDMDKAEDCAARCPSAFKWGMQFFFK